MIKISLNGNYSVFYIFKLTYKVIENKVNAYITINHEKMTDPPSAQCGILYIKLRHRTLFSLPY